MTLRNVEGETRVVPLADLKREMAGGPMTVEEPVVEEEPDMMMELDEEVIRMTDTAERPAYRRGCVRDAGISEAAREAGDAAARSGAGKRNGNGSGNGESGTGTANDPRAAPRRHAATGVEALGPARLQPRHPPARVASRRRTPMPRDAVAATARAARRTTRTRAADASRA